MSSSSKMSNITSGRAGRWKTRLGIPATLTVMVSAMVGLCAMFISLDAQNRITSESREAFDRAANAFQREWMADAEVMDAALQLICSDPAMDKALASGNIETLRAKAAPLLERLGDNNCIVRFNFHTPQSGQDLGASDAPGVWGTKVKPSILTGIELEPTGVLTATVVRPCYDGDKIVGYLKLGREIKHLTRRLKDTQGMEFAIAVSKELIDRDKWSEETKSQARRNDWDQSATSIIVYETVPTVPDEAVRRLDDGSLKSDDFRISAEDRNYRATLRYLNDSYGQRIARIVMMRDITTASAAASHTVKHASLACGAVGLAILVFLFSPFWRIGKQTGDLTSGTAAADTSKPKEKVCFTPDERTFEPVVQTRPPAPAEPKAARSVIRSEFANDPDMIEIIGQFVKHLDDFVTDMTGALDNNCYEELRRLAHQLKGAGGGYGYQSLTDAARTLEDAAKQQDREAATLAMSELNELCRAVNAGWKTADFVEEIA
jgi:HPt (histidine-containing phosphotransfer) domain-containing protein